MIFRKPYAILIKYFKVIHIVMFILFSYLVFALRKIYMFFSTYISTSNFTYFENMTSKYVPWILIVIVFVLLALAIGILLLMHKKEKPVLFYRIMIGYTIILLIVLIYFMTFFKTLDDTVYEPLRIVVNRDIILFIYIFNFFFVGFAFIRGFGFDIKKFSFDKDKKELNLEESDSEEYELSVSLEKDDVKSFLNKHKRELKYYVKENKTILVSIGIIIVVIALFTIYHNVFVENKIYYEKDTVSVGGLSYRVNSSFISNIDKYGRTINNANDYLVINLNIINNAGTGYLDEQVFRVHIGNDYYYPSSSLCDLFSDLGTCYKNQELVVNTDDDYIVIYEIKKNYKDIYLEILKSKGDEYRYSKIKLSYTKPKINVSNYKINDDIEINNTKISISYYSLLEKTSYQYEECVEDNCNTFMKRVLPNTGEIVLALSVSNLNELSDDFIKSAIGIKYNDKVYTGKDLTLIAKYNGILYYSVPSYLKSVKEFTVMITTREKQYNVLLEGEL